MNCIAENEAMMTPMTNRVHQSVAKKRHKGTTMPKPIRSMKTVRKIIRTEGFLMN